MENGGDWHFAQETSTAALPGCKSAGGSTTNAVGEDARTIAGCPAIVTWLASASPQKLFPKISKRSVKEATRGAEETSSEADTSSLGERTAVTTRPVRPAIEPKITPGFNGATKRALPVASVVSRSPFEKFTVTPGVSRRPAPRASRAHPKRFAAAAAASAPRKPPAQTAEHQPPPARRRWQ